MSTQNAKIQIRHDTSVNWSTNNPVLLIGELGYETDTLKSKLGDGISNWNSLSYIGPNNTGTVTSVSVSSSSGIISSISNNTTIPLLSLSLGNITPTSIISSGTISGSNLSGTNTGDQTITLSGDVTGSGTSGITTTIGTNVVTLAKFQQIATNTLLGRTTALTGNVEVLSASQVRTLLSINNVENTALSTWTGSTNITTLGTVTSGTWNGTAIGDTYISSSSAWNAKENSLTFSTGLTRSVNTITVNAIQNITKLSNLTNNGFVKTSLGDGTLSVDTNTYLTGNQTITLSGDVSGSGSTSISTTIGANVVTLAKFQQIATSSILGRITGSTGNVEVLTGTQATTLLDTFTTSLKGLVPSSGGGTTNFLRADGTWAAPPGGGGGTPGGIDTQVQFNDGGNFGGDAGLTYNKTTDTLSAGTLALTNALTVSNGGTGAGSFTSGRILYGNGTSALSTSANLTFDSSSGDLSALSGHFLLGGTLPSRHTQTSGFKGVWPGGNNSNAVVIGETGNGFRGLILASNMVRDTTLAWASQDTTQPTWRLSMCYEQASTDYFVLSRASATSGAIGGTIRHILKMDRNLRCAIQAESAADPATTTGLTAKLAVNNVNGTVSDAVLLLQGGASQSGNYLTIQTSAAGAVASINSSGNFNTIGTVTGSNLSGTNTGDQTITLSGDVTGSGTSSFSATIGTNVVTLAKFQQIATNSILGRVTASTGNVEVLTGTQATALLDTFTTSLKGLVPSSGGGTTNFLRADGTWAAPPGGGGGISDGDKGDITVSSSGTVWTIDNSAVTLAKIQDIATSSILGRTTALTGNVEVLSASQVRTLLSINNVENTALSTWTGSSNITTAGILTIGTSLGVNTASFDGTNPERLKVDNSTSSSVNVISGYANNNNYAQLNIKNTSSGTSASSDIVATADTGNETTNYVDLGINSSGWTNVSNVGSALDGYVYGKGNDFWVGNATALKHLRFFVGGLDAATNERASISSSGVLKINNLSGAGDRMVVADSVGNISTQAIPGGGSGATKAFAIAMSIAL